MVARVDLKLDRKAKRLLVLGAYGEPDIATEKVSRAIAAELVDMAGWLGARDVSVSANGDLAPSLTRLS